jgi:glycolate oxidase
MRTRPTPQTLAALRERLSKVLEPGQLRDDPETLEEFAQDESDTGKFLPDLVAFPANTSQVVEVVRACGSLDVPLTPVGARSGKSGGSLCLYGGLALCLSRMARIVSIQKENGVAVVEPGVITGELMKAVEAQGLFYPPDPNSLEFCSLGGNIAENAGGPRAFKYGVTRDYVLALEWVLPSGEVLRVGHQPIKGVAGYDLVGLFVGSEGTLGVATEITLQLLPLPTVVKTALICFASVAEAAKAVGAVLQAGILPRTLELLDDVSVKAIDGRGYDFPPRAKAALIVEVDGGHEEAVFAELVRVGEVCERAGAVDTAVAQSDAQREQLWAARRVVSRALRALKKFKISEDVAVPRAEIPRVIEELKAMGAELGLTVATYGHAGDGNLHANILYDSEAERPRVEEAIARMLKLTVKAGGTITGEHGVGYAKRDYLALEQAQGVITLQRELKRLMDPSGFFNPGKILPLVP